MPLKFTNPSLKTGFLASSIHKTVIIMRKHIVFFTICSLFGCGCVCGCLGYCCWTDGDIHCFGCCGCGVGSGCVCGCRGCCGWTDGDIHCFGCSGCWVGSGCRGDQVLRSCSGGAC